MSDTNTICERLALENIKKQILDHLNSVEITKVEGFEFRERADRLEAYSGWSVSVQAGECLYSTPRNNHGPWTEVELGFPSEAKKILMPYAECKDNDPTKTVYPYVPLDVVAMAFLEEGGIDGPIDFEDLPDGDEDDG